MKKKLIIVIAIVCLIIAGVITAVIIRNNAVKESAGEEKAGNEDLANNDSMNKFGEAEAPSDMFPNGQDDYEVDSWDSYQKYWDDFSVYGTYDPVTAPPGGETGYNEDYLVEKTTDKGAKCIVDTRTGKVYYDNMILPTGIAYCADRETSSMAGHYIEAHEDQCPNGVYSFTYEMMQDCYGYPVN